MILPSKKITVSPLFLRQYDDLPRPIQKKVDRQITRLQHDITHPGLGVRKLNGIPGIWEGRVDRFYRFTFERTNGVIYLRAVGRHDIVEKTLANQL